MFALLLAVVVPTVFAAPLRPNIFVIYTDDQGYGDVSALNPEAKFQTPHIDRLAREGLIFTDGRCADTVCSPSRYALLTGRYAWRTTFKSGAMVAEAPCLIARERPTLAALARQHGYRTAMSGKWHLGLKFPGKTNVHDRHPEIVARLQARATGIVRQGRSTPGVAQKNDGPELWPQLTWIHGAAPLPVGAGQEGKTKEIGVSVIFRWNTIASPAVITPLPRFPTMAIPDPTESLGDSFRQSRRELWFMLITWIVFAIVVTTIGGLTAFERPAAGEEPVALLLGMPRWVVLTVFLPWIVANAIILYFATRFMKDTPLLDPAE